MTTIFEQPLNERIRTFLRLEHLFEQLQFMQSESDSVWHDRAMLNALIEIANVFERADIKTEFFKELDRLKLQLTKLARSPDIDNSRLQETIAQLDAQTEILQNMKGRIGQELRENELLNAIKHRLAIPGGTCDFDLPHFHYWLSQDKAKRHADIKNWTHIYQPVEKTTHLILDLVRGSAYTESQTASDGFFQKSFDNTPPCQLVRIQTDDTAVFPEISGSKHRINIRFLQTDDDKRPVQVEQDVSFSLSCCLI